MRVLDGAPIAARGDDTAARRACRIVTVPVHGVRKGRRLARLRLLLRHPVGDDVVVDVGVGWNLHQLHRAVAPVALRADPDAGAEVGARLQVLVVLEVAVALEQAETARVVHLQRVHLQRVRVVERPPQPLTRIEVQQQPVRVVHLGTEVDGRLQGVLAVEEHAGERRDAQHRDRAPQKHTRLHMHHRLVAGFDREAIGAGDARPVEQGIDHQVLGVSGRAHQPELAEVGKLLRCRRDGVDGNPAGGEPVDLAAPEGAEITGADEHDQLVVIVRPVQRVVDAESGVAEVCGNPVGKVVLAVVELIAGELDGPHTGAVDDVDGHGAVVVQARVEELHLKGQVLIPPQRALRLEADIAPLVVIDFEEPLGDLSLRGLKRFPRQPRRRRGHVIQIERGDSVARQQQQERRRGDGEHHTIGVLVSGRLQIGATEPSPRHTTILLDREHRRHFDNEARCVKADSCRETFKSRSG